MGSEMFVETISNSKWSYWKDCKLKYRRRYVDRFVDDPNPAIDSSFEFGKLVHKLFENGYHYTTREQLVEECKELYSVYKITGEQKTKLPAAIDNFLSFKKPLSELVSTEQKFEVEIDKQYKMKFNGIIDLIIKSDAGHYLVIDYKTSKRQKSKLELYKDPQLMGYCLAVSRMYKVDFSKITVAHYYPLTDRLVTVQYSPQQIGRFISQIKDSVWGIRKAKKVSLLPEQNEWCNWCPFKNGCSVFKPPQEVMLWEQRKVKQRDKLKALKEEKKNAHPSSS